MGRTQPQFFTHNSTTNTNTNTMVQMTGTFTRVSEEGYDEFLKVLNVGFMLRKAAMASTPVMTISESGGDWTMTTKTTMKSIELKFRLGEPFDETTTDGRKCVTTVTKDGNKLITSQKGKDGGKDVTAERLFDDEGLTMTMTCEGVTSKQVYKRN